MELTVCDQVDAINLMEKTGSERGWNVQSKDYPHFGSFSKEVPKNEQLGTKWREQLGFRLPPERPRAKGKIN